MKSISKEISKQKLVNPRHLSANCIADCVPCLKSIC